MVPVLLPVSSHSKKRTRDDKVDEDQGKATGVNLRRENAELQNFFRERKKKSVTQHIDSSGFPKPKKVGLWKWGKNE